MPKNKRRLEWGGEYATGIDAIDEQHRVLFDLINELEDVLAGAAAARPAADVLQAVVAYALHHFVTEERLALKAGVVGNMVEHFAQHQEFNRKIAAFREEHRDDMDALAHDLLRFLKHWLAHHILRADKELARELRGEAVSPATPQPQEPARRLRVAVVEDDPDLREELSFFLSHAGYRTVALADGAGLTRAMAEGGCDVIVLDLGLPDIDGNDLARKYGNRDDVAIVMLTARGSADDRVAGYLCGADAYLVKPIDLRELAVVIERVAKRLSGRTAHTQSDAWQYHPARWLLVSPAGVDYHLTAQQQTVMNVFARADGRVVTRDELVAALRWDGSGGSEDQRLEASISRLRRRLEGDSEEVPLKAARGAGYVFAAPLCVLD